MSVFAIADLHLSCSANKPMDIFGSRWTDYMTKIKKRWEAVVTDHDTVIIPGDISWSLNLNDSLADMKFIDALPGKKLIGKGNHDYWWSTVTKMKDFFEKNEIRTIEILYNNAHVVEDYIVCGTRGWYVEERYQNAQNDPDYGKIVAREASRLAMSLDAAVKLRDEQPYPLPILVYLHFPPVFKEFICREIVDVLHRYDIKNCYFGHIHGTYKVPRTFEFEGISMTLISADFLDFVPMITMPIEWE